MHVIVRRLTLATVLALALLPLVQPDPRAMARNPPEPGRVHPLFDLSAPTSGPFPSDWFTMTDRTELTGRRVSLPMPDCQQRPSDCEDVGVINMLDGFSVQPRLSIPFDGQIDVTTVTSETVFLVP